jgi:hypothetical protein
LRFLKKRNVWEYIFWSSIGTGLALILWIRWGYDFVGNLMAKIDADFYYAFYSIGIFAVYIVLFLVLISPLIFTKIVYLKFSIKSLLISLLLTILIFILYVLAFVYIIVPMAGEALLKNI